MRAGVDYHLPKIRVVMIEGKYGAVIGYKNPTTWTSDWAHTKTRIF